MSRTTKSAKNLIAAVIGQGIGLIISFVSRIVFIKILGTEYLGLNGLFTNILTVLSLAELGIGEAITYSLYKPLSENDEYKCCMLMQFYKKVYTIIGIVVFSLGMIICPFLNILIKDLPDISNIYFIYILFVVNTSVSYFFSYKRNLIIADQKRYIVTIYRYAFYFILNVLQIIFLLINRNYIFFLVLQILFTFLENVFVSIKANKMYAYLTNSSKVKMDLNVKNDIMKNTKAMMMHKVGSVVVSSTDNIIISKFVGLSAVGLYSNYFLVTNALNIIYNQVFTSVTASIGNLCVSEDENKQFDVFNKLYFLNFWIYGFSTVCLLCLLNPFIQLWVGNDFLFSFDIVCIIVLNFYINGLRKSVLTFREAAGLFYKDRWKAIVEAIVNLVFSIVLVLKIGVLGVFLGTLVSSVFVCVWVEPYVLFKYGFKKKLHLYFIDYFKYLFLEIFIIIVTYFFCSIISTNLILSFIIKCIICLFIPNIIIIMLFYKDDRFIFYKNKILSFLKKIINKKIKNLK